MTTKAKAKLPNGGFSFTTVVMIVVSILLYNRISTEHANWKNDGKTFCYV